MLQPLQALGRVISEKERRNRAFMKKALIECRCASILHVCLLPSSPGSLRSNSSIHSLDAFPRILLTMSYFFYFFLSFQVMVFQKHSFHLCLNFPLLQLMFPFPSFNGRLYWSILLILCKTEIVSKYKYVNIYMYVYRSIYTQI